MMKLSSQERLLIVLLMILHFSILSIPKSYSQSNYTYSKPIFAHERLSNFTFINSGNYNFNIKAADKFFVFTKNSNLLDKATTLHILKSKWFVFCMAAIIILLLIIVLSNRTRLILRQNKQLEKKVQFRTLELSKKNEQLVYQADELSKAYKSLKEHQKWVEKQANAMEAQRDELHKANQIKDKLLSIIAHDLRNPLNNAKGYVDLLQYRYQHYSDDKKKSIISSLGKSIESIYNLLITLLNWSGTEHGQVLFNPHIYKVNEIISENIETVVKVAEEKKIEIINNTSNCSIEIELDRNLIDTVLKHLLENAIKYTQNNGQINVDCKVKEEGIVVAIKDNGIGIPKENLDKLFKADFLFSTQGTLNEKGVGLGLAICNKYIEKHKGHIWIENNKEKGSTVYFEIPLIQTSS